MWSRGFLYTFWVIQICLCVLGWALAAFSFGLRRAGGGSFNQNLKTALNVHGAIWVTWATVCFVLIVTQWTMFSKNRLRPWFAVTSNTIMSILWLILFAIAIYSIANDGGSALQPVILGIYHVKFTIPLVYCIIVFRRHRRGAYTPVEVESIPNRHDPLHPGIEIPSYDTYRQPQPVHEIGSVPQIPSQIARSDAYEPLRPGYGAPVELPLDDQSPFHDRNLVAELAAAEEEYANEVAHPRPTSFDPYRAPAPVELMGSPPPPPSIYSQPEPEKRL